MTPGGQRYFHLGYTIKILEKTCSIFNSPLNRQKCINLQKIGNFLYWQSQVNLSLSSDFLRLLAIFGDFCKKKRKSAKFLLRKSLQITFNRRFWIFQWQIQIDTNLRIKKNGQFFLKISYFNSPMIFFQCIYVA